MLKELSFNDLVRLSRQRKNLVVAVVLVLVAMIVSWLLIWPTVTGAIKSKDELAIEQKTLIQLKDKLIQLEKIKYDPDYVQTNQQVNLALQDHKPLLELLAGLDQVARAASIELSGLELNPGGLASDSASTKKTNQKELADSLTVAFKVTGTFQQVTQFMELLEKISPFTTIDSFSVTEGRTKSKTASASDSADRPIEMVGVSLSCRTYFAPLSAKTLISSPIPVLSKSDLVILEKIKEFQSTQLPEQKDIRGGLEDLFGLPQIEELYSRQTNQL